MKVNYSRDSQRDKVYGAENKAFTRKVPGGADDPPPAVLPTDPLWRITANEMLPEIADVYRYAKWVLRLKRVQAIVIPPDPNADRGTAMAKPYPIAQIGRLRDIANNIVIDSQKGRGASAYSHSNKMTFSKKARKKWIVVHELAHILSPCQVHHHWQFAFMFLMLTRYALGREAERALKHEFKRAKVRYTAPRKTKQLTEGERAILRERLKIARSLRKVKPPQ